MRTDGKALARVAGVGWSALAIVKFVDAAQHLGLLVAASLEIVLGTALLLRPTDRRVLASAILVSGVLVALDLLGFEPRQAPFLEPWFPDQDDACGCLGASTRTEPETRRMISSGLGGICAWSLLRDDSGGASA